MWQGANDGTPSALLPAIGVAALVCVLAVGLVIGTSSWHARETGVVPQATAITHPIAARSV
jgi:hypothetical protein